MKQKARRLGGPEQNSEISEGERWLVYTRARRARDVSTYRGARWAMARELPALASNTRASDRALTSNTRERGVEHSRVTRERGVEHSRALDGNARVTTLALASVSHRTRE